MFGGRKDAPQASARDHLAEYLQDGWEIEGYAMSMLAAGALHHSVLLKKGDQLVAAQITKAGDKEIGRRFDVLAPIGRSSTVVVHR